MAPVKDQVFFCVLGCIISRNVRHHMLLSGFQSDAQSASIIRRIERFFKHQVIDYKVLARGILACLPLPYKLDLVLDRTNWQFGKVSINLLVLSVILWGKHAVPLFWQALPKSGSSKAVECCDLLQRFIDTFGYERIQCLTADREFIAGQWLSFLEKHNIPFYIRLRQNRLVEWEDKHDKQLCFFFHHLKAGQTRLLVKQIAGLTLTIVGTRSAQGELVLVATNQSHKKPQQILNIYRRRWATEPLFKNINTAGINLEDTHMTQIDKLEKLLAIIAVATVICLNTGRQEQDNKPTPYRKTVNAPLYSLFRRGFDALRRYCININHLKSMSITTNKIYPLKNVG